MMPRSIHRKFEDWIQRELSRTGLNVAPIAAYVENIHKGKRSHLLNMLFKRLLAGTRSERRSAFLPGVANQTQTIILYRFR